MERCPCCQARLNGPLCGRCQADLSLILATERAARFWLGCAIQHWQAGHYETSVAALETSLQLHPTPLARALRHFIVETQSRDIARLLANRQWLTAKRRLYQLRRLHPHSPLLRQLDRFSDHLLVSLSQPAMLQ